MFKFPSSMLCCHSAVHTMTPSTHLATAGTNHLFPIFQYAGVPIHRTTISIHYFKLNIVDRPEKASLACLFLVPDPSIHRQMHGEIQGQLHAEFVMVRYIPPLSIAIATRVKDALFDFWLTANTTFVLQDDWTIKLNIIPSTTGQRSKNSFYIYFTLIN